MYEDLTIPDPSNVLELLVGFRKSKTMFAAVSMGLFDLLEESPQTAVALAKRLKADERSLELLLDCCVGLQLLVRNGDIYSNTTEASTYLCSQSPRRMTGYINYSNSVMWLMWQHLEDAIREGSHRWKQAFGTEGPIFSSFFRTEEAMNEFLMGMNGFGMITSPHLVNAFDLSRFKKLVDLGGATGHFAIAACQRYKDLQAVVYDLPHALGLAEQMIAHSGMADRLSTQGGDFFTDPLPVSDLYALGRIVHDWSPEKIEVLLRKIFEALPAGGGLIIGEKIVDDERTGPPWALMQSLNMLVCTEGQERTLPQYAKLLEAAGFQTIHASRTSVPLDIILAIKS